MSATPEILNRIRKLMKLASGAGSQEIANEAAAALKQAQRLMREHGITDVKMDDDDGSVHVDSSSMARETAHDASRLSRWDKSIAAAVTRPFGVGWYYVSGGGYREAITFYGLPTDIAVAKALFGAMRRAMSAAVRSFLQEERDAGYDVAPSGVEARSFRDGFCRGLNEASHEAVESSRKGESRATDSATRNALVVASSALMVAKESALEEYAAVELGEIRPSRPSRVREIDAYAYDSGRSAGRAQCFERNALEATQ